MKVNTPSIIYQSNSNFSFTGDITFYNLYRLENSFYKILKSCPKEIKIDFKDVTYSDSALLAFVLTIIKKVKNLNIICTIMNLPSHLMAVAKLSGLDRIDELSSFLRFSN